MKHFIWSEYTDSDRLTDENWNDWNGSWNFIATKQEDGCYRLEVHTPIDKFGSDYWNPMDIHRCKTLDDIMIYINDSYKPNMESYRVISIPDDGYVIKLFDDIPHNYTTSDYIKRDGYKVVNYVEEFEKEFRDNKCDNLNCNYLCFTKEQWEAECS